MAGLTCDGAVLSAVVKCQLCSCLSSNLTLYVSHLRLVHSGDPSFRVICGNGSCSSVFTAFAAYNSHIYRHHRAAFGFMELYSSASPSPILDQTDVADSIIPDSGEAEIDFNPSDVYSGYEIIVPHLRSLSTPMKAVKYLLHLREGHKVSQVALMDIIAMCNEMCMEVGKNIQLDIQEKRTEANVEKGIIENVLSNPVHHPFEDVNTIYRYENFCVNHLNCLVCYMHAFIFCLQVCLHGTVRGGGVGCCSAAHGSKIQKALIFACIICLLNLRWAIIGV